jgi:hypothetical protein
MVLDFFGPLGNPCGRKMGGPRDATGDIKFSNNRGPTLRTPCGEKELALNRELIFEAGSGPKDFRLGE